MADDIDHLIGIAEIAGVFVGFAALVTVIAKRSESAAADIFRLVNVVIISVMIITAALLPLVLSRYGLPSSAVWRISSGFLYVINLLQIFFVDRWTVGYATAHSRSRMMSLAVLSLSPFFHIPLLLCIVGLFEPFASAFFMTAIVASLFQVVLFFADLVVSMIAPAGRAQGS